MPRFSDEFLSELRLRTDIEQLISGYVPLKRRGKNLVGLCPFHNEKTPSFTVYPENQSFYCFGCGVGGEAISFVRNIEHLDFTEAVRFLCDRAGMQMPNEGFDDSLSQRRRRMYELNREAARFFHEYLLSPQGAEGLAYYQQRGYSKRTITRFGLGYAPNAWHTLRDHLRGKGYSYEELYEANLVQRSDKNGHTNYYDNFRNRVIVPIIDPRGNVVAFGGRVLDDSKPKYVNTSDTLVYKKSLGVFGLNFAKNSKANALILVEGYMDAISLHQAGFDNAIACLGTALTSEMAHLLLRYADEIILSYDADEAGQKATQKAIGIFTSLGAKLRVARLSGGKDPDEILRKYGPERYRSLIEGAANDIEFALLKARDGLDLTSDDGKLKYLNLAAQILSNVNNSLAVDIYASRLAEELGVDKQAIQTRIGEMQRRKRYAARKQQFQKVQQQSMQSQSRASIQADASFKALRAEERILTLLYRNPDFLPLLEGQITESDFADGVDRRLFSALCQLIENGDAIDMTHLEQFLDTAESSKFAQLLKKAEQLPGSKKELSDCIQTLKKEQTRKAQSAVAPSQLEDDAFRQAILQLNKKRKS